LTYNYFVYFIFGNKLSDHKKLYLTETEEREDESPVDRHSYEVFSVVEVRDSRLLNQRHNDNLTRLMSSGTFNLPQTARSTYANVALQNSC